MSPSTEIRENREFASEMKFLVTPHIAEQIYGWATSHLAPDPNGTGQTGDGYRITSLYFDTARFDVFHKRGSYGRSKYRIRRYGASQVAFLERKLRTRGMVTKRRSISRIEDLNLLEREAPSRDWSGCWFHKRLAARALKPVAQISYWRRARVAMTDFGPIRLTLDTDLRATRVDTVHFDEGSEAVPVLDGQVIIELKFLFQMPRLFKLLVEEFALSPGVVSKYRLAASDLVVGGRPGLGGSPPRPSNELLCRIS